MQADAGFVEDVERTDQTASQRGGQIDALAFSSRERIAQTVECQVSQANVGQEVKPVVYFIQQTLGDGLIVFVERQGAEEFLETVDRHFYELGNVSSAHLDIVGFFLQASSVTGRADGFSPVTGEHDPVLDLVLVFFKHFEERVDAYLFARSVPEIILLLLSQFIVRSEDREVMCRSFPQEFGKPFAHFLSPPADNGSVVDTQGAVGDDEMFIDADDFSEAFAGGAGSDRRIE